MHQERNDKRRVGWSPGERRKAGWLSWGSPQKPGPRSPRAGTDALAPARRGDRRAGATVAGTTAGAPDAAAGARSVAVQGEGWDVVHVDGLAAVHRAVERGWCRGNGGLVATLPVGGPSHGRGAAGPSRAARAASSHAAHAVPAVHWLPGRRTGRRRSLPCTSRMRMVRGGAGTAPVSRAPGWVASGGRLSRCP